MRRSWLYAFGNKLIGTPAGVGWCEHILRDLLPLAGAVRTPRYFRLGDRCDGHRDPKRAVRSRYTFVKEIGAQVGGCSVRVGNWQFLVGFSGRGYKCGKSKALTLLLHIWDIVEL